MGAVRLFLVFLVIGVGGICHVGHAVTLNGVGNGPSNCGDINNLLGAIENAHQSISEQDAANRLLALIDIKGWNQYCVLGDCISGLSALAGQMYEESTIFASWKPSQLSGVRYGENFASVQFKLAVVDVCGGPSIVDAEFNFYCQGQQGRATQIHTFFEKSSYNQLHRNLVDCVNILEQRGQEEEIISDVPNVLPEIQEFGPPPKFILEEEVLETPPPVEE